MLVQVGLCRTCSETTLLVFSQGGYYVTIFVIVVAVCFSFCFVEESLMLSLEVYFDTNFLSFKHFNYLSKSFNKHQNCTVRTAKLLARLN